MMSPEHRAASAARCRARATHGMRNYPEYRVWSGMKRRCKSRALYVDQGISVCQEWAQSFERFYADLGPRPSPKHTVDRIDNLKGYEPGNCRWATPTEQANNKRNNRLITYRDQQMTLPDAIRVSGSGINRSLAHRRLDLGWSVERAVETAPGGWKMPRKPKSRPPRPIPERVLRRDETGNAYGRLRVIKEHASRKRGQINWLCQCECGSLHIVCGGDLRSGGVKSCGCLRRERAASIGRSLLHSASGSFISRREAA